MKALILLTLPLCLAFQLPFGIPGIFKTKGVPDIIESATGPATPKIAIIGAGAGGSSAAFWISKAKERFGLDIDVEIYDKSPYVGGRSTIVYPHDNTSLPPLELGASIFVQVNKNLWRATNEFNLTRRQGEESYDTGIWDGEQIVVSMGNSWLDTLKLLWRYGLSPKRVQSLVDNMIKSLLIVYDQETPRWDNITSLSDALGFASAIQSTTEDYLTAHGVSELFAQELVDAATRVNYAQNVNDIHALEGMASMAASGAAAVQGGNRQIFEQFVNRSGAKLLLNTTVSSIKPKSDSSHHWVVQSNLGSSEYMAVILASPFHSSGITLPESLSSLIPEQPYVHLHVTLLTTTSPTFNPAYFGLSDSSKIPQMILTTSRGVRNGGQEPEFNSLSYLGATREGEWAVKIFSMKPISDEWLQKVFFGKVGWVYRKEWESYPILPPTGSFPPVRVDRGLFYVNAFEPFISTMETETVASRNVVDLLLNEEFQTGICGARISATERNDTNPQENFVYGWDC